MSKVMCMVKVGMQMKNQIKKWLTTSSLHSRRYSAKAMMLAVFASANIVAAPFVPASDDEVLLALSKQLDDQGPAIVGPSSNSEFMTDAQRIKRAQELLRLAYETANEDAFGQAEALLAPWLQTPNLADIPAEAQLMLAVIKQHNHEFATALELLGLLLRQQPAHPQALLQRAQINLVLGNYAESKSDCHQLLRLVSTATTANCLAQVESITGHARETYTQLKGLVAYKAYFQQADYNELMLTLATISHRLGLVEETGSYYKLVLEQGKNNQYALLQYTDYLLEQERYADVQQLLDPLPVQQLTLELQIKKLEAMHGSGMTASYTDDYQQLREVFAVASARKENFPNKEYARYLLQTPERAQEALQAALANWQYQKEPGDLLLLVRSAIAANSDSTLELARNWLATTGLEDERIGALLGLTGMESSNTATGED